MHRLYLDDAGSASNKNEDDPILGGVSAPRRERHSCFDNAAASGTFR
jgi:hypothetical protein